MSIDRIGKGGGVSPPSGEIGGASSTGRADQSFQVDPVRAQSSSSVSAASLERLRSGEITLPQYLDERVHEATEHLVGRVAGEQLAFIRQSLREQLSTDPVLVDLVQSATGSLPSSDE